MQIQITRPDATVITLEGTLDEVQKLLAILLPAPPVLLPMMTWSRGATEYVQNPGFVQVCKHDYPPAWWGVTPPTCNKCGQQAFWPYTSSTTTTAGTTG